MDEKVILKREINERGKMWREMMEKGIEVEECRGRIAACLIARSLNREAMVSTFLDTVCIDVYTKSLVKELQDLLRLFFNNK